MKISVFRATNSSAGGGRVFERLDANGDDAMSAAELDAAVEARQARRDARHWWRD
jgi:hypothetical protein